MDAYKRTYLLNQNLSFQDVVYAECLQVGFLESHVYWIYLVLKSRCYESSGVFAVFDLQMM